MGLPFHQRKKLSVSQPTKQRREKSNKRKQGEKKKNEEREKTHLSQVRLTFPFFLKYQTTPSFPY
jgi:hypothetical protein